MSVGVTFDDSSRITKLAASGQSDRNYGYDDLDRLVSFGYGSTSQLFEYDVVGNRTRKVVAPADDTYVPSITSNQLASVTGTNARTFGYDSNGSLTSDGAKTFTYNDRGRMIQSVTSVTTTYNVANEGERFRKANSQADTVFHYDGEGRVIAESSAAGTIRKEYVYLGSIPVAILQ